MSDTSQAGVGTDLESPGTSRAPEVTVGTDAAYAAPAAHGLGRPLRNISEVRHFFRTNEVPIYFVGATPFNLLGLDRWVRNFSYVTYYDGLGRCSSARLHTEAQTVYRIRVGRGDQQLAARQSRGAGSYVPASPRWSATKGRHGLLRRRDREDLRRARL